MIKAILCDLGNVIVFVDHKNIARGLAKFSDKNEKEIYKFFLNSTARKRFDAGKITAAMLFADFKGKLNLKIGFIQFKKIWCSCLTGLNKGMANLLYRLKKNYRLVLLSNTDEIHFVHCRKNYKVLGIFDDFALSYRAGCSKPNPLIYFHALKKAKAFPSKTAYIDDMNGFVTAAKFIGIRGIQYKDMRQLKRDLRQLNVRVQG